MYFDRSDHLDGLARAGLPAEAAERIGVVAEYAGGNDDLAIAVGRLTACDELLDLLFGETERHAETGLK